MIIAAGGLLGGLFFLWISGLRIISPTEYGWVMQSDWRIHFLGWHFFRREPWQWPPGRIDGYFHAPDGTTIGFTDSIPLVAFLLKPWSGVLPDVFQYQGLWLLTCFVLQGAFGVLIARIWTPRPALQLLAGGLFVLMPTLLIRVGHPSLCAHFLVLWALSLYWRTPPPESPRMPGTTSRLAAAQAALGLVAGLVHPYLAVMVLALLVALAVRTRALGGLLAAVAAVVLGWWASGLFTAGGTAQLATEGLGYYSTNVLALLTPSGWSTLLPELPVASPGQTYEGFQYVGAGGLLLMGAALVVAAPRVRSLPWSATAPVLIVAALCAIYALSPRVTLADRVIVDLSSPALEPMAVFRATGRFFWPMAYLLMTLALAVLITRLGTRTAAVVLAAALAVQLVDLRQAHAARRATSRSAAFHGHQLPATSPFWAAALPHYDHMVMVNPPHCGEAPAPFEWPAFLAGRYGLTINAGEVARPDVVKMAAYCRALQERTRNGVVGDDTIYLVHHRFVEPFRMVAQAPVRCSQADGISVCVTERSYARWRHLTDAGGTEW